MQPDEMQYDGQNDVRSKFGRHSNATAVFVRATRRLAAKTAFFCSKGLCVSDTLLSAEVCMEKTFRCPGPLALSKARTLGTGADQKARMSALRPCFGQSEAQLLKKMNDRESEGER
eukprot:927707-Pleurochrysis_carterae.AAC.3